jgi:hypothetical protein
LAACATCGGICSKLRAEAKSVIEVVVLSKARSVDAASFAVIAARFGLQRAEVERCDDTGRLGRFIARPPVCQLDP